MRVLIIPSWYPPNGGDFFVHQTKWLMERGIEAHIITVEEINPRNISWNSIKRQFSTSNKKEFNIPTSRFVQHQFPKLFRLNTKIWIQLMLWLSKKYIRKHGKPDLIQVHSCMWGGVVAQRIKKKYHIPYIITEHRGRFNKNSLTSNIDIRPWFKKYLPEVLRNASAIIPVTSLQVETLEAMAGVELPCYVIPNPVDENLFSPCHHDKKEESKIEFLNISMFNRWKAIDILLQAFADARKSRKDIYLHLVGDGPDRDTMRKLANKLEINDYVKFHGLLNSQAVHERLCAADFLVLSSITEGQPVVVGEAILSGTPVIATNVISTDDIPDFCGYIAKAGDSESLTRALLQSCEEKDKFTTEQIRNFGLKRFAKNKVISEIIKVLDRVSQSESSF